MNLLTFVRTSPAATRHSRRMHPKRLAQKDKLAKRILNGLGFCGHYMHFHGGGVSGKAPIICLLAKQPGGEMSQQELGMHFDLKPGSLSEILSKLELNGLIERSRNPKDRRQLTIRLTETGRENARIDQAARIRFREQRLWCPHPRRARAARRNARENPCNLGGTG